MKRWVSLLLVFAMVLPNFTVFAAAAEAAETAAVMEVTAVETTVMAETEAVTEAAETEAVEITEEAAATQLPETVPETVAETAAPETVPAVTETEPVAVETEAAEEETESATVETEAAIEETEAVTEETEAVAVETAPVEETEPAETETAGEAPEAAAASEDVMAAGWTTYGWCGDDAWWDFDRSTGTLTIGGEGEVDAYNYGEYPWYGFSDEIEEIVVSNGIINIPIWAFLDCVALETVSLPESLKKISGRAFLSCKSLKEITIPASVDVLYPFAFQYCWSLRKVVFLGDAPYMDQSIGDFGVLSPASGQKVTIYYPAGNDTWTKAARNAIATEVNDSEKSLKWQSYGPGKLTVTNRASDGKPKLSWKNDELTKKYEVYRATSKNGTYKKITTTTKTSLVDTGTETGKRYYYKVRGVLKDGTKGKFTAVVSRVCDLPRPNVTVGNVVSTGRIKLTWSKVTGAAKYQVYRSKTGKNGSFTRIATINKTSFVDDNAVQGQTYYYKVKAICSNTNANSAFSVAKKRTTLQPKQPTGITILQLNSDSFYVEWKAVNNATGYQIRIKQGSTTKTFKMAENFCSLNGAKMGKKYTVQVRSYRIVSGKTYWSAWSGEKSITLL